jgi:hypothetical protein
MTSRITQSQTPTKEYGRKPYLVTPDTVPDGQQADYRFMMDTTWHKAQDNEYMVVQSVMKKPYQQQNYQMMENEGNYPAGINTAIPKTNYDFSWQMPPTKLSMPPPKMKEKKKDEETVNDWIYPIVMGLPHGNKGYLSSWHNQQYIIEYAQDIAWTDGINWTRALLVWLRRYNKTKPLNNYIWYLGGLANGFTGADIYFYYWYLSPFLSAPGAFTTYLNQTWSRK